MVEVGEEFFSLFSLSAMSKYYGEKEYLKCNIPMTPRVRLYVGWSAGWPVGWLADESVCHNFQNGREITLQCSYQSTCYHLILGLHRKELMKKHSKIKGNVQVSSA